MNAKPPVSADLYEPVIGLEVHAQLLTKSKMFCGCSADYAEAAPNTHVCAVCGGMPGALPVTNGKAVEYTISTALALNCSVDPNSKFDRKNYSYPDLPKGYQISQYDQPIGQNGWLEFRAGEETVRCGITRVHLEEDTGKSFHMAVDGTESTLIDYNRSGVPLMEIVGEPDLRSPEAARGWFAALRQVLMYLGVCDGNLQKGSMRADVNVSVARRGEPRGAKVEIKNLNSFRSVQRALEFEIERQVDALNAGNPVAQETRGWSEVQEVTLAQRSKEFADDYRYFPEPDLPPLTVAGDEIDRLRSALPELPLQRAARLERQYAVSAYTAGVLTAERALANYFETVASATQAEGRVAANWVTGDLAGLLNDAGVGIEQSPIKPDSLADLLDLLAAGTISGAAGKTVLEEMFRTGSDAQSVVSGRDLAQVDDRAALTSLVDEVVASNPAQVEQYRGGKTSVLKWFVGQVMQRSRGKAKPDLVQKILEERLNHTQAPSG